MNNGERAIETATRTESTLHREQNGQYVYHPWFTYNRMDKRILFKGKSADLTRVEWQVLEYRILN